jgi:hydrogenase nickel incorporation protein HypA/HybF
MDEHELVSQILAAVDETAYRHSANRVVGIHLAVGGRRIFNLDSLREDFGHATRGTVAEGAKLFVKVLPVRHHCQSCGFDFEASSSESPCPECAHPHTEMVSGEEVRLVDVVLDDEGT